MIQEYLDGDLQKEKEAFLFTHLSSCPECREEFKQQNLIKTEVQIHQKEVSGKFEQRLFDSLKSSNHTFIQRYITRRSPVYFSYMLGGVIIAVILLSILQIGSLRADLNDFKGKYEAALFEYKAQTNKMNSIINAGYSRSDIIRNNTF
jgi:predicted anti-sigma-YlaC factor YlaD